MNWRVGCKNSDLLRPKRGGGSLLKPEHLGRISHSRCTILRIGCSSDENGIPPLRLGSSPTNLFENGSGPHCLPKLEAASAAPSNCPNTSDITGLP